MKTTHIVLIIVGVVLFISFCGGCAATYPVYKVWKAEMNGKAAFKEAEQNRRIIVEEAQARYEAEKLNAQAEIERARGMAAAMDIENGKLTPLYNQYLFIRSLEDLADKGDLPTIIYLPTQGMLPIMDVKSHNLPVTE